MFTAEYLLALRLFHQRRSLVTALITPPPKGPFCENISVNFQLLLAKTGAEKSVDDLVSLWTCSDLSAVIWQKNKGHPINFTIGKNLNFPTTHFLLISYS